MKYSEIIKENSDLIEQLKNIEKQREELIHKWKTEIEPTKPPPEMRGPPGNEYPVSTPGKKSGNFAI